MTIELEVTWKHDGVCTANNCEPDNQCEYFVEWGFDSVNPPATCGGPVQWNYLLTNGAAEVLRSASGMGTGFDTHSLLLLDCEEVRNMEFNAGTAHKFLVMQCKQCTLLEGE
ncbi:MAG TPA: hypothetical protein VJP77_08925 [Planctomycetota bacterium]|nr:hypothetical protein [Planctomycetota bacterium]